MRTRRRILTGLCPAALATAPPPLGRGRDRNQGREGKVCYRMINIDI